MFKANPVANPEAQAKIEKNEQLLNKLFAQGLIDGNGNILIQPKNQNKR